jgi:hypothetical protein
MINILYYWSVSLFYMAFINKYIVARTATIWHGVWIVNRIYWIPIQYTQLQSKHFTINSQLSPSGLSQSHNWQLFSNSQLMASLQVKVTLRPTTSRSEHSRYLVTPSSSAACLAVTK